MNFMKQMPLIFILSLLLSLMSCTQESSKNSNSSYNPYNNNCAGTNYYAYGCPGYNGNTTGTTTGGTTGNNCFYGNNYYYQQGCPGYCQMYPTHSSCAATTGGTTGTSTNPYPYYYSAYVDKNWQVLYPYVPSISCTDAVAPTGVSYTPYETRKGTITLKGQVDYDPNSGQSFFDTTSELLQTVDGARNFFWGDSTLKVRFKANVQPTSANTTAVCPGRAMGQSSIKGYGKIKFDLYLIGRKANGTVSTVSLGTKTISVNSCTSAIDLSTYASQYPNGIYLKIANVYGNQNWLPGTYNESQAYDTYGYVTPQNPYVENTWKLIRNAECWTLDIEVAADGTKTFN